MNCLLDTPPTHNPANNPTRPSDNNQYFSNWCSEQTWYKRTIIIMRSVTVNPVGIRKPYSRSYIAIRMEELLCFSPTFPHYPFELAFPICECNVEIAPLHEPIRTTSGMVVLSALTRSFDLRYCLCLVIEAL